MPNGLIYLMILWSHIKGDDSTIYIYIYTYLNLFCFQVPAPADLLKFIRCYCKVTSKNPCSSNSCTCHNNGLKCVTACGDCRGLTVQMQRRTKASMMSTMLMIWKMTGMCLMCRTMSFLNTVCLSHSIETC
jgi:hypothetical protein